MENEVENVALHNAEGELARVTTELEEEKLKNADLYSKNTNLTVEILFARMDRGKSASRGQSASRGHRSFLSSRKITFQKNVFFGIGFTNYWETHDVEGVVSGGIGFNRKTQIMMHTFLTSAQTHLECAKKLKGPN